MSRHVTARLFVAVDPPADARQALARWARGALRAVEVSSNAGMPLRVLDPDTLHVTLCFLGNQPVTEMDAIGDSLASVSACACELTVGAPLWLPPRRPRALAVELHDDSGELARAHRGLVYALREVCELPQEQHRGGVQRHRFRPHVTVARMRAGAAPRERALAPTPALSFTPPELVLYRSWLSEQGASYEQVAGVPLA